MEKLICPDCGKRFPFNPKKHEQDEYLLSPCCKAKVKNPECRIIKTPEFVKNWEERIKKWKKERERKAQEATKLKSFLDKYFPINPISGRRAFSVNDWRKGRRPTIHLGLIMRLENGIPSAIEGEIRRLQEMGVNVVGEPMVLPEERMPS